MVYDYTDEVVELIQSLFTNYSYTLEINYVLKMDLDFPILN